MTETLREMLTRHEGDRLQPYLCPAGHNTIGRGWNMDVWPLPKDIASYLHIYGGITQEMSDRLLELSLECCDHAVREIFKDFDSFSERRQWALIDMCFNLGAFGLMGFKRMRRAIAAGDWIEAANQVNDSDYWRQLGGDPKGQDDGKLERPEEIAAMLREG